MRRGRHLFGGADRLRFAPGGVRQEGGAREPARPGRRGLIDDALRGDAEGGRGVRGGGRLG